MADITHVITITQVMMKGPEIGLTASKTRYAKTIRNPKVHRTVMMVITATQKVSNPHTTNSPTISRTVLGYSQTTDNQLS
jgi:hypothetical protein